MSKKQLLKTAQWNIGGGLVLDGGKYYSQEKGVEHIVEAIRKLDVDLITIQEAHVDSKFNQIAVIAKRCGYPYWVSDNYDKSHVDETQMFAQGIISRFPIREHTFSFFNLPRFKTIFDGKEIISHLHGLTECKILLKNKTLDVKTFHSLAYYKFNLEIDSEEIKIFRKELEDKLLIEKEFLLQGDFNFNDKSLEKFFPKLFANEVRQAILPGPTTPKGKFFDHFVFKGLEMKEIKIIYSVLTDHYPIKGIFEIISRQD